MARLSRQRRRGELRRRAPQRPPYDRVLIVCEGSKTEPQYLAAIRQKHRIPAAHIRIMPSALGTEPRQVVEFAVEQFLEARAFERVFAVFDRDQHLTYNDALKRALALNGTLRNDERRAVEFRAIPSVPCFELWLVLHFEDVFAFNHRSEMIEKLKPHIPGYAKGAAGIYNLTEAHLVEATARAIALKARFTAESGIDPFTEMHELVAALHTIVRQT